LSAGVGAGKKKAARSPQQRLWLGLKTLPNSLFVFVYICTHACVNRSDYVFSEKPSLSVSMFFFVWQTPEMPFFKFSAALPGFRVHMRRFSSSAPNRARSTRARHGNCSLACEKSPPCRVRSFVRFLSIFFFPLCLYLPIPFCQRVVLHVLSRLRVISQLLRVLFSASSPSFTLPLCLSGSLSICDT